MSRGSDKIAQLENALEKKDQEINVLRLATRRLEDELQALQQRLEDELAERDENLNRLKKSMEERMSVIEGTTWSGRLTTKYLTVCEKLKVEPDVGVLFALSTGSRTITSDRITENGCMPLAEVLKPQDCRIEVLELAHSNLTTRGTIFIAQTLAVTSVLTTLNLASCSIGAAGAIALWHYVKGSRCPLEVIDIRDNNVGLPQVVEAMEAAVSKRTTLRAVGFDFSRESLVEGLRVVQEDPDKFHLHVPTLLDLSACSITDDDVPAVVSLLLRISVTTSVNLNANDIGDDGASMLAKVLEVNESVDAIALADNRCEVAILVRGSEGRMDVWSCLYPSKQIRFEFVADFDENGIMYFLGTQGRTQSYDNPAKIEQVTVFSSEGRSKNSLAAVVGRERAGCAIYYKQTCWFAIDLGEGRSLAPSAYTLRHGREEGGDALRNWEFQGSDDGKTWITIKTHESDQSLVGGWSTATWSLDADPRRPRGYRMFRILKKGPNSTGKEHLHVGGVEMYGDFYFK
mmetsp:Transcript_11655/g.26700  ORF Transcript_11655/g.26700 Transcript_11655/m.26700 type:complete len:516 (-) Transcript_11655:40-1587(-)